MDSVFFQRIDEYSLEKVRETIKNSFEYTEFFNQISKDSKIFLKPNLLSSSKPEDAVTTHPVVFQAVIEILKENGYSNIKAGDSPGIGAPEKVADTSGLLEICKSHDVEFVPVVKEKTYNIDGFNNKSLILWEGLEETDVIVNLPKLKTHCMMLMTLGVKNFYGLVPGKPDKAKGHFRAKSHEDFAFLLMDIFNTVTSKCRVFSIVDGILGMEGNGPGSGDPIKSNVIFASFDAYLMDFVISKWVGVELSKFPLYSVYTRNVKNRDEEIDNIINRIGYFERKFILPEITDVSFSQVPDFLKKLYNRFCYTYPVIRPENCIKCMNCVRSCPADTIIMKNGYPYIKLDKCIKCFCCHEMCEADTIDIKKSFVLRCLNGVLWLIGKIFKI